MNKMLKMMVNEKFYLCYLFILHLRELTDTTYFYLGGWGFWFYILKTDVIQTLFFFNINVQYLKNNYLEHYLLIFLVKKEVHYNLLLMN